MGEVALRLVAGAAFILAGRWVYANPGKLLESSLYAGGTPPFLSFGRLWVRGFATMLIFGGLFAIVSLPAVFLFAYGDLGLVLGVAACVLGAIFLRPRSGGVRAPLNGAAARTRGRGALLTRKGKLFVATMVGGGLVACIEILLLLWLGLGRRLPDVVPPTVLVVASALLLEMLFVK